MDFHSLDPQFREALAEDLGEGDVTTGPILDQAGKAEVRLEARLVARQECVLAGWPVFVRIFELLGPCSARCRFEEGDSVPAGTTVGVVEASPGVLLKGERVALNFLQRLCGIAGLTRRYVGMVAHTKVKILDTRKMTPLWRAIEKYAVRIGGGTNHRFGLYDQVLIKENHIALAGGIGPAVRMCRKSGGDRYRIEVEVTAPAGVAEAVEAGADIVLLDNMSPGQVRESVAVAAGRCLLEVSGGVNEGSLVEYAETGVDFISMGVLTHSCRAADLSLLLSPHE